MIGRYWKKEPLSSELDKDTPFILCRSLIKLYRMDEEEVIALQGLDLTVEEGEIVAIIGVSGSGKSTLLNILGGLERPSAGRVLVGGENLLKMSDSSLNLYRQKGVGFVWQQISRNLIPYLTAVENVELPMVVAGQSRRQKHSWSRELLNRVGLGKKSHCKLVQMSGGEQQRVAIAIALANRPRLLLADEPTGEVDSITASEIFKMLHHLNQVYGLTIIVVSHDLGIASEVDRVKTIRDGKIITETIHRDQSLPGDIRDKNSISDGRGSSLETYAVLDSAGRLAIPQEYRHRFNIADQVKLEILKEGILLRAVKGKKRKVKVKKNL